MKRKLIALWLVFFLMSACGIAVGASGEQILFSADFENGQLPEVFDCRPGMGKIEVVDSNGRKALFLNHNYEGPAMSASLAFAAVRDGVLISELVVMQPDMKADGEILYSVSGGGQTVLSIETKSGNIVFKKADGSYGVLVAGYLCDTWYTVKVETDILNGVNHYSINGMPVAGNVSFISAVQAIDAISMKSSSMPGFMFDALTLSGTVEVAEISIVGDTEQAIYTDKTVSYEYYAYLLTNGGEVAESDLVWAIEGDIPAGVQLVETEVSTCVKLVVSPETATDTVVVLTVHQADDSSRNASISVRLVSAESRKIAIKGDRHLSIKDSRAKNFDYSAVVYDQFDSEMTDVNVEWMLAYNGTANLSLSGSTVTVSGSMPEDDEYAVLTARLCDDPNISTSVHLVVQPYDVYFSDMQRWNVMLETLDNLLAAASRKDGANPLIAEYISPYTNAYGYWHHAKNGPTAVSTLANDFTLMKTMDGISNLTGDMRYSERVDENYQWYIDYGRTPNGLIFWGNHAQFDMDTGLPLASYMGGTASNLYHEVEARDIYLDPMMKLNKERTLDYCSRYWRAIIKDWSTYRFNRHAKLLNCADESVWESNSFVPPDPAFPYVESKDYEDVTFASTATTLLRVAEILYDGTNDENVLRHMKNLMYLYLNTRNNDTNMFGIMFTSPHFAEGRASLEKTFGQDWWNHVTREQVENMIYGDFAYNQFSDMLVEAGRITEDEKIKIQQAATADFGLNLHIDMLYVADMLQDREPETTRDVYKRIAEHNAAYLSTFYDYNMNKVPLIAFTCGAHVAGLRAIRPGYWGSIGTYFPWFNLYPNQIENLVTQYLMIQKKDAFKDELADELEVIWDAISNMLAKQWNLGDIGDPFNGVEPNLNMQTTATAPEIIEILIKLFDATGNRAYLNQARVIGNNIVTQLYLNGYLVSDSNLQYIVTESSYHYALVLLEERIRGEEGLVPVVRYTNSREIQDDGYDEYLRPTVWAPTYLESATYDGVLLTKVWAEETEVRLSPGESQQLHVKVYPDDADNKTLIWEIENRDIVSVSDSHVVTAKQPGETVIYAVATASENVTTKPIRVVVE